MSSPEKFTSTVLGYPRIGPRRELKFAVEKYWSGAIGGDQLEEIAAGLRAATRAEIAGTGIDAVPGNTFSYYDQVLDTAVLVGAIPDRYRTLELSALDTYFAMARGRDDVPPLEMTKWFDTNYHYLVPEIGPDTPFALDADRLLTDVAEAREQGIPIRPVLVGPLTFLLLAKREPTVPKGFLPIDRADDLVAVYADLLARLADSGVEWVQLDEPAFVADRSTAELDLLARVYARLAGLSHRPRLLVASYFGDLGPALEVLATSGVDGIAVDLVAGPAAAERIPKIVAFQNLLVVAGVVDGRNVWRTNLAAAAATSAALLGAVGDLAVSTSCSLLHVPYDLDAEQDLEPQVSRRLAFARQKLQEVVLLGRALGQHDTTDSTAATAEIARTAEHWRQDRDAALRNDTVRDRIAALRPTHRERTDYPTRAAAQQQRLQLPPLPTTTIGSFPQTADVRRARGDLRAGRIDEAGYDVRMHAEIDRVVALQESLGLDVLVHGEPERNDMVQYFGERLDGFAFTDSGWVQSYGSRCVRPPILHGDVARPAPMTVRWSQYAQSRTTKPMKGMLTGPVTILAWSFVRDDQALGTTADQVALALRDEVTDLENAGIAVVQVDEPALRELLPLRESDRAEYLEWAVGAFRLATAGAQDATQIHTHLCYSEFGDVIGAIDGLDADVTTIEAARSKMEILDDLRRIGYSRGIGPGVYDIHSPRIPTQNEINTLVAAAAAVVPSDRLWINPDCGLKTRGYTEVEATLQRMVTVARHLRTNV